MIIIVILVGFVRNNLIKVFLKFVQSEPRDIWIIKMVIECFSQFRCPMGGL